MCGVRAIVIEGKTGSVEGVGRREKDVNFWNQY